MKLKSENIDRLFDTVMHLSSLEECYAFFGDVCTVKEIQDMAQRLDAAILLSEGNSYQKIVETTGLSTATIGRVSRCLNYGEGGYKLAISRLKEKEGKEENGDQ